jgi:S1-C subfamily serine protease
VGFANDASGTSPAQAAGVQHGDIIVGVSRQPITSQADLAAELLTQAPGTQVLVNVQRGSAQQTIKVKLGERPVQP